MAKKTVISVVDDLDGSESAETVTFAYGGTTYEIDLSPKNRNALDDALTPFIKAARTAGRSGIRRAKSRGDEGAAAIRAWATENGIEISSRGRVPRSVRDQYENR